MKTIDKQNPNRSLVLFVFADVAVGRLDLDGQIWFGVSRLIIWFVCGLRFGASIAHKEGAAGCC